jgi:hypothetical protein
MRIVSLCALLSVLAVAGCATSKGESYAAAGYDFGKIDKVAIIGVSGRVYGDAAKAQIMDLFKPELMKRGYVLVERADVQRLLKEIQFQSSGVTSPDNAAKAGKILNVPVVLTITVGQKGDEKIDVTAELVEVESGQIIWHGNAYGSTNRGLATVGGAVLGAAAGAVLAGGSTGDRVLGAVAGGAVGGVAGYALSPEMEDQIRKIVAKACEGMPYRIESLRKK